MKCSGGGCVARERESACDRERRVCKRLCLSVREYGDEREREQDRVNEYACKRKCTSVCERDRWCVGMERERVKKKKTFSIFFPP